MKTYDAIVVGAGHNGLTNAAFLAKAGLDVLCVEKNEYIGGATVSRQHANFIVTEPGALADHVLQLLELIRRQVYDHSGIEIEQEIVVWRRGDESDTT